MENKIDEFHYHEALDRASVCGDILEHALASHPVIKANEKFKDKVDQAQQALWELYQMIGAEHLE